MPKVNGLEIATKGCYRLPVFSSCPICGKEFILGQKLNKRDFLRRMTVSAYELVDGSYIVPCSSVCRDQFNLNPLAYGE